MATAFNRSQWAAPTAREEAFGGPIGQRAVFYGVGAVFRLLYWSGSHACQAVQLTLLGHLTECRHAQFDRQTL